jgi:hypothetical protein
MLINRARCKRHILELNNLTRYTKRDRVASVVMLDLEATVRRRIESIVASQVSSGKTITI